MTTRARYHVQQRLRDQDRKERNIHNAEPRFFTDGWRAVCVCGLVGEWHSLWVTANADALNHNAQAVTQP